MGLCPAARWTEDNQIRPPADAPSHERPRCFMDHNAGKQNRQPQEGRLHRHRRKTEPVLQRQRGHQKDAEREKRKVQMQANFNAPPTP
jgi:hypothetical protein